MVLLYCLLNIQYYEHHKLRRGVVTILIILDVLTILFYLKYNVVRDLKLRLQILTQFTPNTVNSV